MERSQFLQCGVPWQVALGESLDGNKFDGYFPAERLIVEFHGPQHRDESFRWNKYPKVWEAQQFRDAEKERQVVGSGMKYMVIWYDEPFEDESYLLGRLVQLGVRP